MEYRLINYNKTLGLISQQIPTIFVCVLYIEETIRVKNPVFLFFIIILVHVETIERFGATAAARSSLSYKLCSSVLNILVDVYETKHIQTSVCVFALYYITFILLKKKKTTYYVQLYHCYIYMFTDAL